MKPKTLSPEEMSLEARAYAYANRLFSESLEEAKIKANGAKTYLVTLDRQRKDGYRAGVAPQCYPMIKCRGMGYFAPAAPAIRIPGIEIDRYEFIHDSTFVETAFRTLTLDEATKYIQLHARYDDDRNTELYEDVLSIADRFLQWRRFYDKMWILRYQGKAFCVRLAYPEGIRPLYMAHPRHASYLYIRDTLSLTLLLGHWRWAELILRTPVFQSKPTDKRNPWVYNNEEDDNGDPTVHITYAEQGYERHLLHRLPEGNQIDIREVSHTSCFLEGYYNYRFGPNAKPNAPNILPFIRRYVFSDWEPKYGGLARTNQDRTQMLAQIRRALYDYETPPYLTTPRKYKLIKPMMESLAEDFLHYCAPPLPIDMTVYDLLRLNLSEG